MRFTLKQLAYFDAAMRRGSIAKAAVEMNISQSSINSAIDTIEHGIGADLFQRVPAKGISPTQTGQEVGKRISAFLEQVRLFEADLMSVTGEPTGTLRLGCYAPPAPYVLPPILSRISEEFPGVRIELVEGDIAMMADLVTTGAVDLVLTYRREIRERHVFDPLFRAFPWALVPAESPMSQQESVSLRELSTLPMVLLDLPTNNVYVRSLFEDLGVVPNIVHTTKSSSVLRGLVASNFGYSILNICGPNDRDGRNGYCAVPINDAMTAPDFGIAYAALLEGSAMVNAVRRIAHDLKTEGAFQHILLDPAPRKHL